MDISEVLAYAPHRAPMVWVDEVISFSDNAQGGECLIKIKSEGHYMGPKGLRASSCVEFIAQSYGYISIAARLKAPAPDARPLKRAFLAAFKNVVFASSEAFNEIAAGAQLHVTVSDVRHVGPITSFEGKVIFDGKVLCSGELKVYSEK